MNISEQQKIIEGLVAVLMIAVALHVWALGSLASPEKAPYNKIADQLERFANWVDKLADKLGAWRASWRARHMEGNREMTQEEEINRVLVEIEAIFSRVNADFDRIMTLLKRLTSVAEAKPITEKSVVETLMPNDQAVRARYAGVCQECGLVFYVGDWIVINNNAAIHAEHYLKEKYFPIRNLKEE